MKYRVLTISREYGCGGSAVAQQAGDALGWTVLDSVFIEAIAGRSHVDPAVAKRYDERADSWLSRISRKALWHGTFEAVSTVGETEVFDAHTMAVLTRNIILESAQAGNCVIVGRGSQCALAGRGDTFHVFVHAPRSTRLPHLDEKHPKRNALEHAFDSVDRNWAEYVHLHYQRDVYDRHLYDLMVNTRIGIDRATHVILAAMGFGA